MEKVWIKKTITEVKIPDASIDDVIQYFQLLRDDAVGNGYRDIEIASHQYYEDHEVVLYGCVLETDEEYEYRMGVEARVEKSRIKRLAEAAEKERQEYERLKKKFEESA